MMSGAEKAPKLCHVDKTSFLSLGGWLKTNFGEPPKSNLPELCGYYLENYLFVIF